jgi:acetyl-CoA acetyltransferase
MTSGEAYITGIGQSQIGRGLTRHPLLLTIDAVREALAEAGLSIGQIDGVASYPGRSVTNIGFSPVGTTDVIEALGLKATYYAGGSELTSQLGAIVAAVGAVKSGQARHIICFRTVYEAAANARPEEYPRPKNDRAEGFMQWLAPFNAVSPVNWVAQYAMRHMHRYGLKREQLAQIVLTDRRHAVLNPRALVRKALTMDEYMGSRPISAPLSLLDCDRYTDASTVLIVSAGDAVDEVSCTPIRVAAMAHMSGRHSWDQDEWMAAYPTGRQLWTKTDYKPKDVDVAQLYDGFSFLTCTWLEGLGFCDVGEVGPFLEGGQRIALDGELPLNTFGGQIGAGRLHGFGFAHEAVVQLRGEGGARQVPNDPKVAVCSAGGGPLATAILLVRD